MPIYEYLCLDCNSHFDVLRPMRDSDAPISCEKCTSDHTKRCLTVFYAQSSEKVMAGGNGGCGSCNSSSCSTCRR